MKIRYVHTNLIAKDWKKLSAFYQKAFACVPLSPQRDLSGAWVDQLTGLQTAKIKGEHLLFPGYGDTHSTLEIFSYEQLAEENNKQINNCGLGHLAFEVEDVSEKLKEILEAGGGQVGEVVETFIQIKQRLPLSMREILKEISLNCKAGRQLKIDKIKYKIF